MFTSLETPCLLLDRQRLQRNAVTMRERARQLGVALRPHLKTSKSVAVASVAKDGIAPGITVSTLKEAEYFASAGFRDILLAVGITPNKFERVATISQAMTEPLLLVTDSVTIARELASFAQARQTDMAVLIEIDCGEHRSGLPSHDPAVLEIARILAAGSHTSCRGVMTHAGHSYASSERAAVAAIAEAERSAVVDASERLRAAGYPCPTVSVGSTPTVTWAEHLQGVSEVRCGIYLFWDLAQLSRGVCSIDDIAMTVLASVIGHNRAANSVVLDAGALALSKDTGANHFLPDAKLGYVCDALTGARLGTLSVDAVHQEHGTVLLDHEKWYAELPVGSQVRIIPNHACLTAASFDAYHVIEPGKPIERWERITGW